MGTNFYAKHILTEQEYKEMEQALAAKQLNKLRSLLDSAQKEYHIGKRSCGWQFLFSPQHEIRYGNISKENVSPWENTLASIKEYLSRPNVEIYDEYGTVFTPEQFWNEEIGYCLYNDPKKYINGEQYYKENPREYNRPIENSEFTTKEGLRFATTDDFC